MSLLTKIRDLLQRKASQSVHPLKREGLEEIDRYDNAEDGDRLRSGA